MTESTKKTTNGARRRHVYGWNLIQGSKKHGPSYRSKRRRDICSNHDSNWRKYRKCLLSVARYVTLTPCQCCLLSRNHLRPSFPLLSFPLCINQMTDTGLFVFLLHRLWFILTFLLVCWSAERLDTAPSQFYPSSDAPVFIFLFPPPPPPPISSTPLWFREKKKGLAGIVLPKLGWDAGKRGNNREWGDIMPSGNMSCFCLTGVSMKAQQQA